RVQSVAVRLVVEREREIRSFVPEEYWEVFADLNSAKKDQVRFQVARHQGENFRPLNQQQTDAHLQALKGLTYKVAKREDKPTRCPPSPTFISSTLQQAASTRLGFSAKKTMPLAQRLYESGYITSMRTASTNLSQDALNAVRGLIGEVFGDKCLLEKPRF